MQCQQGEHQRETCRHINLGQGEVGKEHCDPADRQGQQPAMPPGQIAKDQREQGQRHDTQRGGAGGVRREATAVVQIQDQQDGAGYDWQHNKDPRNLRTPTSPRERGSDHQQRREQQLQREDGHTR
jgi:hypothetical protein